MTDTTVTINGQSAGPAHQGGFYRFSYDITNLVKPGRNDIEVVVSKESSNKSVNHAERRGDYWTFGGIYRPVWLEARPRDHIVWTAIDARADGSFYARAHLNRPAPAGARLLAQVFERGRQNHWRCAARRSCARRHRHLPGRVPGARALECGDPKSLLGEVHSRNRRGRWCTSAANASVSARSKSGRAMASISMATRSCSRASIATASIPRPAAR